jgi:hypothetical protein
VYRIYPPQDRSVGPVSALLVDKCSKRIPHTNAVNAAEIGPTTIPMDMNQSSETLNLVKQYFNICNAALATHREKIAFGTVLALINSYASGSAITLQVIDDAPAPPSYYTTRFVDGEFTPVEVGEQNPDSRFTLNRSFLEDVAGRAGHFIEHPEQLDWSWLRPGK